MCVNDNSITVTADEDNNDGQFTIAWDHFGIKTEYVL